MSVLQFTSRELACPVCSHSFRQYTPKSNAGVLDRRDADFCPYFNGPNPVFYAVWVCPHCGFAAYKDDFRNLNDSDRLALKVLLSDSTEQRRHDFTKMERPLFAAMLSYRLAMRCYQARRTPPEVVAGLHLRLAWMCRYGHDLRREHQHLDEASRAYQHAFDRGLSRQSQTTDAAVAYLIGECDRRLGRGTESISWYLKAIQLDVEKGEIFTKARDQLYEARESIRFFELLKGVAILRPLAVPELALLSVLIRSVQIHPGRPVVRQGEPGTSMFLVAHGTARAEIDGQPVGTLTAGEVLGEMSLLSGQPRTATVVAEETCEMLEIERLAFKTVLQANPEVAGEIARIVADRRARNAGRAPEDGSAAATGAPGEAAGILTTLKGLFELA